MDANPVLRSIDIPYNTAEAAEAAPESIQPTAHKISFFVILSVWRVY
jgi:hypothetical protein